ncbi:retrovirus-related pol polyprotein from transposon TNT 1-94 [Tanacetum coccineum]
MLTKNIDAMSKGKSEKGLVVESFDWDEESVSSEDEGVTKVKAFMAIAEDEPSVGKADARSGQWVQITMKKVRALGGRGKRKEQISLKEVVFTKADESPTETALEITSDFESKYPVVSKDIKKVTNKKSAVKAPKKKALTEPGPKVVFGDNSSGDTEGYGSVNCNGITFTRVAYTQGTIFNQNNEIVLIAPRRRDVYVIDMSSYNEESNAHFVAKASSSINWLWHKRLSHLNFKNINKLAKQNLVAGLPSLTFSKDKNCSACEKGKHHRASFKTKRSFSISKCLHLLHMDLFGPVKPQTISHNKYTLVIVDEYSRYTWVFCLKKKSDAADCIMSFIRKMENLNEVRVKELRSDNGTEFRKHKLEEFCDEKGISQNFSSPCTPEQNCVAERRNKTLIKATRTMLNSANLPRCFWGKAVNTACYTQNRSIIVKRHVKIAYDVFRGRSPDINYLHVFGCSVHIHNHRDHLGKFDEKDDDGFFLGYSHMAKAFRDPLSTNNITIPNHDTPTESLNLQDSPDEAPEFTIADDHPILHEPDHSESADNLEPEVSHNPLVPQDRWSREKHIDLVNIIGKPLAGVTTRRRIRDSEAASAHECMYVNFLSEIEPKKLIEALEEEGWIIAMQ